MCLRIVELIAAVFTAIGTVAVAVLAIWGNYFRYKFAAPQLQLTLNDSRGDLTHRSNQRQAYFFHLKVKNKRLWSPAIGVRVQLERIARRRPDGSFLVEPLVYPLPLIWTPMELREFERTITDTETCDLGFLDQNADKFILSTLITPNKLQGFVGQSDAIRVHIGASGRDGSSSKPLFLEIAWDGIWTGEREEIQKHLVVKAIASF
jgi:hypothetical protein